MQKLVEIQWQIRINTVEHSNSLAQLRFDPIVVLQSVQLEITTLILRRTYFHIKALAYGEDINIDDDRHKLKYIFRNSNKDWYHRIGKDLKYTN
jgi:hypothetical protein